MIAISSLHIIFHDSCIVENILLQCIQSSTPSAERFGKPPDDDVPKRNVSDQALRFEMEQQNVARSRTLKRLSEVYIRNHIIFYVLSMKSYYFQNLFVE